MYFETRDGKIRWTIHSSESELARERERGNVHESIREEEEIGER